MLIRRVLGVALVATMAVIAIPATAEAKTVKAKNASALLAASEVGKALGATVSSAVTTLPTQTTGVTGTESAWTADGATNPGLAIDLVRGPGMKSLYDQTTLSSGTTPVSGFGKAAKFGETIGLVILVDASTAVRITIPTQAVDEKLAKLAVAACDRSEEAGELVVDGRGSGATRQLGERQGVGRSRDHWRSAGHHQGHEGPLHHLFE